ncbi:hypothetical protein BJ508DRAFT_302680 [Ascobolus immersus RN42]|uniref:C2H2-type domain-containing protein n=1 Tax=Ascobolus immersus RN42 TaxID=1160509 RepID=A0A3N4INS6_ASCIM|nr:hypothetical protein BJ508DRAFT_302680 [Ascobolus immersus RN42]
MPPKSKKKPTPGQPSTWQIRKQRQLQRPETGQRKLCFEKAKESKATVSIKNGQEASSSLERNNSASDRKRDSPDPEDDSIPTRTIKRRRVVPDSDDEEDEDEDEGEEVKSRQGGSCEEVTVCPTARPPNSKRSRPEEPRSHSTLESQVGTLMAAGYSPFSRGDDGQSSVDGREDALEPLGKAQHSRAGRQRSHSKGGPEDWSCRLLDFPATSQAPPTVESCPGYRNDRLSVDGPEEDVMPLGKAEHPDEATMESGLTDDEEEMEEEEEDKERLYTFKQIVEKSLTQEGFLDTSNRLFDSSRETDDETSWHEPVDVQCLAEMTTILQYLSRTEEFNSPIKAAKRCEIFTTLFGDMSDGTTTELAHLGASCLVPEVRDLLASGIMPDVAFFETLPLAEEETRSGVYARIVKHSYADGRVRFFLYIGQTCMFEIDESIEKTGIKERIHQHELKTGRFERDPVHFQRHNYAGEILKVTASDPEQQYTVHVLNVVLARFPRTRFRNKLDMFVWDSLHRLLETCMQIRFLSYCRTQVVGGMLMQSLQFGKTMRQMGYEGLNGTLSLADLGVFSETRYGSGRRLKDLPTQCHLCGRVYKEGRTLLQHLNDFNHDGPTEEERGVVHINGKRWHRCLVPGCTLGQNGGLYQKIVERNRHMETYHQGWEVPAKRETKLNAWCEPCQRGLNNLASLRTHMKSPGHQKAVKKRAELRENPDRTPTPPPAAPADPRRPHVCQTCPNTSFKDSFGLKRHYETKSHKNGTAKGNVPNHPKQHRCEACNEGFTRPQGLANHRKTAKHAKKVEALRIEAAALAALAAQSTDK